MSGIKKSEICHVILCCQPLHLFSTGSLLQWRQVHVAEWVEGEKLSQSQAFRRGQGRPKNQGPTAPVIRLMAEIPFPTTVWMVLKPYK